VLGLGAAPPVSFSFEDVHLLEQSRLSGADVRFDAAALELVLRLGVIGAAREVGLAQAAFDLAHGYASERRAFGKRIAEFQALAFGFADAATELELMRSMVYRAASAFDREEKDSAKHAAMAIAECHEGAMSITDFAVQVLGGSGYVQDYPVEKWMRDAKTHMSHALHRGAADLLVGRAALEGGRVLGLTEDGPMPQIQSAIF
jgi:alkylation response protein AidB-like acyl-CoA dehydrogenase